MDSVTSPPPFLDQRSKQSPPKYPVTKQAIIAELVLLRVPQLGPASYWALQEVFGNGEKILAADLSDARGIIRQPSIETIKEIQNNNQHPLVAQANHDFEWLNDNNVAVIPHYDDRYPYLLKTIHQAPPVLFVQGEIDNLFLPQIAVVGSRHPSPTGRENALRFSQQLSTMGFIITSGLALGIDAAAHSGALKNAGLDSNGPIIAGSTIAVIGTGIDKIYPRSNSKLRDRILENGGTFVTEFPLGAGPQASHFPRRNRIISGMSLGVLVVEAAIKSGSLITARYALQQNREVFAIPGSIHNPLSRGCHSLLREGATLVESVDDMREPLTGLLEFKWRESHSSSNQHRDQKNSANSKTQQQRAATNNQATPKNLPHLSDEEKVVFTQLGFDQTDIDVLAQRTQLSPGSLLSALMSLELKGLIEQQSGTYQRLPEKNEAGF